MPNSEVVTEQMSASRGLLSIQVSVQKFLERVLSYIGVIDWDYALHNQMRPLPCSTSFAI